MPTTASSSAAPANRPMSHVVKRDCAVCALTRSASVPTLYRTTLASTSRIAARTAGATDAGSTLVRITSDDCCPRSRNGKYKSGSAVGFSGSPRYFTSPTTPTIVSHGLVDDSDPNLIRLPIGSWPGQNRFATRSLTTTAGPAGTASSGRKVRPFRNGTRIVLKKSGVTRCTYPRGAFWAVVGGCPSAL